MFLPPGRSPQPSPPHVPHDGEQHVIPPSKIPPESVHIPMLVNGGDGGEVVGGGVLISGRMHGGSPHM